MPTTSLFYLFQVERRTSGISWIHHSWLHRCVEANIRQSRVACVLTPRTMYIVYIVLHKSAWAVTLRLMVPLDGPDIFEEGYSQMLQCTRGRQGLRLTECRG